MKRRTRSRGGDSGSLLLAVALLLVVLLVVATAGGPSAAFTSGALDRGSTAAVTDDTNGLLGLDVAGSVSAGSSSRLVTVTNQLDHPLDVAVSSGDPSVSLSNAQATLDPGESVVTAATVGCDSPPTAVTVTVTAVAGSQFSATAAREATVGTSDCSSGTGPFSSVSGSATTGSFSGPGGGSTGSVALSIENTGSDARIVTAFEVVAAGDATALSFGGPKPVNVEAGKDEVYIDATGGPTDSEAAAEDARRQATFGVGDGQRHSLDQSVTIDPGESAQVSLYQFVADGSPYTFQSGDEVTLALTLQDGTRTTVTVTL